MLRPAEPHPGGELSGWLWVPNSRYGLPRLAACRDGGPGLLLTGAGPGTRLMPNSSSRYHRFKCSSPSCQEAAGDAGNCSCSGMLGRNILNPNPSEVTDSRDIQKKPWKCPCPGRHVPHLLSVSLGFVRL